ncbi:MAG: hypothetical protein O7G88_18445 [bacterium]|nr:hypothetical protein [bacterium]
MKTVTSVAAIGLAIIVLTGCSRPSATDLLVGGIYSVTSGKNEFSVIKIIALKEDIIHIRIYKDTYQDRPETLDPNALTPGPMHDGKAPFSMGSLPFHLSKFLDRKPRFIMQTEVTDDKRNNPTQWQQASHEN